MLNIFHYIANVLIRPIFFRWLLTVKYVSQSAVFTSQLTKIASEGVPSVNLCHYVTSYIA